MLTTLFGGHLVDLDRLPSEPIVVDVGACQGAFIKDFSVHRPDVVVHALEPCPTNVRVLREMRAVVYELALVGELSPSTVQFHEVLGLPEWGSIYDIYLEAKVVKKREVRTYEVSTVRVNELLKHLCVSRVDYLKMDIEGAERDVLNTMNPSVSERIGQISLEVHPDIVSVRDVGSRLRALGFDQVTEGLANEVHAMRTR